MMDPLWQIGLTGDTKDAHDEVIQRRQQRSCLPPLSAAAVEIGPEVRVQIDGLESSTGKKFNGRTGIVREWHEDRERWAVAVDGVAFDDLRGPMVRPVILVSAENIVACEPKLWLTVQAGGLDSPLPPEHSFYKLKVMQQDGTMRDARGLYEWIQQFCIEQCALLIGMQEKGVKVDLSEWGDMEACALAVADRFDVPQHCMGCARWWTSPELFSKLLKKGARRSAWSAPLASSSRRRTRKATLSPTWWSRTSSHRRWRRRSRARRTSSSRGLWKSRRASTAANSTCATATGSSRSGTPRTSPSRRLGAQPCIIEYEDYERDIEVTVITEKSAADMEAAQAAEDLQQRLRFGL